MTQVDATTTAISGLIAGGAGLLLGQSVVTDISSWINTAGGFTSLGFAVWYAWYTTTKTMPEKDAKHAETVAMLVKEFREETTEQRKLHEANIERMLERMGCKPQP